MPTEDAVAVISQALNEPAFAQSLAADPGTAFKGRNLSDDEKGLITRILGGDFLGDWAYEQRSRRKGLDALVARGIDLGNYTVQILKDTLNNAKRTYGLINKMNVVMFSLGVVLFAGSASLGAFTSDRVAAGLLAGLGASTFVTLFLLGPIKRSQSALSNLVQVEILFMNFFDQITYWNNFALTSDGSGPPPLLARVEKASEMLQRRSEETVKLLESYVEGTEK